MPQCSWRHQEIEHVTGVRHLNKDILYTTELLVLVRCNIMRKILAIVEQSVEEYTRVPERHGVIVGTVCDQEGRNDVTTTCCTVVVQVGDRRRAIKVLVVVLEFLLHHQKLDILDKPVGFVARVVDPVPVLKVMNAVVVDNCAHTCVHVFEARLQGLIIGGKTYQTSQMSSS